MRRTYAVALAAIGAASGAFALAVEARFSIGQSLRTGHGLVEALFLYLRFFTILTNLALVALQAITAVRLARRQALPAAPLYDAALVYAIVTGVTYELLLRGLWSPRDWRFVSDMILHDLTPILMLAVWLLVPPRTGARWRDCLATLIYPAAYLAMTLVAGAHGEGYPYDFLNVARLGLPAVLLVALAFLAVFLVLGVLVTGAAKLRTSRSVARAPCVSPS